MHYFHGAIYYTRYANRNAESGLWRGEYGAAVTQRNDESCSKVGDGDPLIACVLSLLTFHVNLFQFFDLKGTAAITKREEVGGRRISFHINFAF